MRSGACPRRRVQRHRRPRRSRQPVKGRRRPVRS
jgi:hypothetical protein